MAASPGTSVTGPAPHSSHFASRRAQSSLAFLVVRPFFVDIPRIGAGRAVGKAANQHRLRRDRKRPALRAGARLQRIILKTRAHPFAGRRSRPRRRGAACARAESRLPLAVDHCGSGARGRAAGARRRWKHPSPPDRRDAESFKPPARAARPRRYLFNVASERIVAPRILCAPYSSMSIRAGAELDGRARAIRRRAKWRRLSALEAPRPADAAINRSLHPRGAEIGGDRRESGLQARHRPARARAGRLGRPAWWSG